MTISFRLPDFGKLVEEVTAEVKSRIERRTPVRTGLAQRSWEIESLGETEQRIVNNVSYVGYLENGTSKMAPSYMVRTTMEEVPDIIAAALEKQQQN